MKADPLQRYFLMSFRFDKSTPEEFGLKRSAENGFYICPKDNSLWVQRDLYDFGWGDETGFVRLPECDFEQLWHLMMESGIQENRYGSAAEILRQYADELLSKIYPIISDPLYSNDYSINDSLKILELNRPYNRSSILGKSQEQIKEDYNKWLYISKKINL
ncbi:hypothetical protein AB4Z50_01755 [Paenibacillus sp. 2TAB26]|uniref:hypothetical protein n=1 Tax=Paenibacillus sp. 2TAB26 TaxID=3233005 RepID=UPI003F95792E